MLAIGCYKALASLLCQAALPPCIHINDSFQAPLPHCNSYCLHVQEVKGIEMDISWEGAGARSKGEIRRESEEGRIREGDH